MTTAPAAMQALAETAPAAIARLTSAMLIRIEPSFHTPGIAFLSGRISSSSTTAITSASPESRIQNDE